MTRAEALFEQKPISQDLKSGARCTAILARGITNAVTPAAKVEFSRRYAEYQRNRFIKSVRSIQGK